MSSPRHIVSGLKMEEPHERYMGGFKSWERPLYDRQQRNQNLSTITARN